MRKDGDKEAADEVKKLKKPSETAWAVNQLARNNRRQLNALLKAGERLRKAQGGGGKRDELRAAVADEREHVARLTALAEEWLGKSTEAKLDRVRNTLHAAAGDEETRELVDAGRLAEDAEPVGFGLLGPVEGTDARRRARKAAPAKAPGKGDDRAAKKDEAARRKARRELETARKRERDAREKADRARTELKRARAAAEDAAKALQSAERRAKEAEARESDAQDKLAQAEEAAGA